MTDSNILDIECPHCSALYKIDTQTLPEPKMIGNQQGWEMECSVCDHSWIMPLPKMYEPVESPPQPPHIKTPLFKKVDQPDSSETFFKSGEMTAAPQKKEKSLTMNKVLIILASLFFFLAGLSFIIWNLDDVSFQDIKNNLQKTFTFEGDQEDSKKAPPILKKKPVNKTLTQKKVVSDPALTPKIDSVQYKVDRSEDGFLITVFGSITNPHDQSIRIPPLSLSIWSDCDDDIVNGCLTHRWEHTFSKTYLNRGESHKFNSKTVVRLTGPIKRLDVDFID